MSLVEVDGLTIRIDRAPVVDNLSFKIGRGMRLGLVGESGAGKTLIALALAGLLPDAAALVGTIRVDSARIGMVFQASDTALNPLMTAGEQIAEAVGIAEADRRKRVTALLSEVGLEAAHAHRYPDALTAGQRQLVLIAMALALDPDLLIADEPVAALDPPAQRRVLDLIKALCASRNMALLLISHDLKAVAALCGEVMVLQAGKIIEAGPLADVLGRPQRDLTKELVAAGKHRARTLMRSPIGANLLEIKDVTLRFPRPWQSPWRRPPDLVALDAISFSIRRSECLAVVGPAGSGKTVLGRSIAGLDRVTEGAIEMDHLGYRGTDLPKGLRRDITMVFQQPRGSFNPRLTVGESVTEPLRLEPQLMLEEQADRLVEVVRAVGLGPDMLTRYPATFSDGDIQRLAFARALIAKPRLVVFDEPAAALDVSLRGEMLMLLNRLRADFGLTCMVLSRDLDTVRSIADRVLVLEAGRIVEAGKPADLLEAPQHPFTQALVRARLPELAQAVAPPAPTSPSSPGS
ncbi:MAG: ABC transporter ATP-binding protein [Devosia sp.]